MRLKQLKLAGFKTFVDVTTLLFPEQLVAIVGPNGCGKSNIIDAVRWVMGEGSAKNLRGESMTDVIFNGSSHRKAVGQASVELVFDNSLGRLTGQYASYQELSIKRLITRDGDSSYYLNGSRCRRRDISDIFLGTGAGTRGYSIIGQGTISRLVEARPDELRVFLEEAAGLSKYKERRRETLLRIEHTKENLARVADISAELAKQLHRLERQAQAAEQYKLLIAQERRCKAEILALKWQILLQEQQRRQLTLVQLLNVQAEHQAQAAAAFKRATFEQEKLQARTEECQTQQTNFYRLGTEIARLEESIQQQQREKERLKHDQQQVQEDWQLTNNQLKQDKEACALSETSLKKLQEDYSLLQKCWEREQLEVVKQEAQQTIWNSSLDRLQQALNKTQQQLDREQLRLEHLEQQKQNCFSRLQTLQQEQALIDLNNLKSELAKLYQQSSFLREPLAIQELTYQDCLEKNKALSLQVVEIEKLLRQAQDELHSLDRRYLSLDTLQKSALKQPFLPALANSTGSSLRVIEQISVDKKWQYACELILKEGLQALVLDSFESLWEQTNFLSCEAQVFLKPSSATLPLKTWPRLVDKIKGLHPSWLPALDKIYTAETLSQVQEWLPQLAADESIILSNGDWFAINWLKLAVPIMKDEPSLLRRQEELRALKQQLLIAEAHTEMLVEQRDHLYEQINRSSKETEMAKDILSSSREALHQHETLLIHKEQAYQQAEQREKVLVTQTEELHFNLEDLVTKYYQAEQERVQALKDYEQHNREINQLRTEKTLAEEQYKARKESVDAMTRDKHALELAQDREKIKMQQFYAHFEREQTRLVLLGERGEALATRLLELEEPNETVNLALQEKIKQYQLLETSLNLCRSQLEENKQQLELENTKERSEEKLSQLVQEKIQQEKIEEQALLVRTATLVEALNDLQLQAAPLLAALPLNQTPALQEQVLGKIIDKIKRLGAINLAAIEEYGSELQRKQHLDEQYQDLQEALEMLNLAIEKMDKETEQRLKLVFDEVNRSFQALFPRLFGGGHAMLELTCDNLLEAGIIVMAQPPGKRNSTIHLLSGGEKAMTAIALVFAIFELNPSPFCMLDEVDAPLDEVNIGRFCDLVKKMSQFVQFLFITHNKVTMELAEQLIGVTMQEPGVSRIVAVDVEQALSMSES